VLLVEDQAIAQKIAVFYLNRLGYEVDLAKNGGTALELYHQKRDEYDVIFMDLGLADIDGLTVTETIRKSEQAGEHTPIVALSAHDAEDIRQSCRLAGFNDFISKPILQEKNHPILAKYIDMRKAELPPTG
jgi:CheY-like chemotaxis protein